ncbi:hypothetical protein JOF35_004039 [Streptomyces demainii]|uniref:Uncharacterized protein n=1 Tax=Streptomyces demainii TaxID=588122 RepID=A0ABT9KTI3_9ACTN|nr:hypothetical protein [Streptomyces demainii]
MLASTVQFSNNDPYPVTHTLKAWYTGTGSKGTSKPARTLRHPTACPTLPGAHPVFHAEAVLTERASETVPNSQRSTHEQPCETLARIRPNAP